MFYGQGLVNLHGCALGGRMKRASEAQWENLTLFEELFNRFSNIAVTRLDWTGLPKSTNERFLNQTLYLFGNAVFFNDPKFGYLTLPCTVAGEYNMYYDPVRVNAYSFNYNKMLDDGEFVYIRNNPTATPTAISVFEYTRRMSDVLRTIDVRCKRMKHPFILMCEEKERLTYLNLMKKITDNEVLILGSKDFGLSKSNVELIPTNVDTDLMKLWEVFHSYETLLYTALGIDCVGQEKRERLLVDEVNSNNMVTQMSIETNIKELEAACEKINDKWGLDISVRAKGIEEYREGGIPNGKLYDNPIGTD